MIAPEEVQIFSGLTPPEETSTDTAVLPGLVETLRRVETELRSFLLSVETGEYFHKKRAYFDPAQASRS